MKKLIKPALYLLITGIVLWVIQTWWFDFKGSWVHNSAYVTFFAVLIPAFVLAAAYFLVKLVRRTDFTKIFGLAMLSIFAFGMQSCSQYAKTNQQVVYSEDCGKSWNIVQSGQAVPKGHMNRCFIKETMPGFAMQGSLEYYVLFTNQVKVQMDAAYDYEIFDPLKFMNYAKTLGKANSTADGAAEDNQRFESAENRVIDVRIKKITSDQFQTVDVVKHDINQLEEDYQKLINEDLAERGVRLTILELVPDYQSQTKGAIDAYNALRIYKSNDMEELGKQIMVSKAGAPTIVVGK